MISISIIQKYLVILVKTTIILLLSLIVTGIIFNAYLYPRNGLKGFDENSYFKAILKVGQLFAASENMQLKDILYINSLSSQENCHKHYAWGILHLADQNGYNYPLWISIRFSDQQEWYRDSISFLLDPRDTLLFIEQRPKNMFKTNAEIKRIYRETKRQLREYFIKS